MKNILLFAILFTILTVTINAQTFNFYAHDARVINVDTKKYVDTDVSINISVTDYYMTFDTDTYWKFKGNVVYTSKTQFYSYATDSDGTNCRVWFDITSATNAVIGIEYSDILIIYAVTLIE